MKRIYLIFLGLMIGVSLSYAQTKGSDDEIRINPDALRELEQNTWVDAPKADKAKPWLQFDETLPSSPFRGPQIKRVLTLHPYKANTAYNWDPVYMKKIKIDKDSWRPLRFYALTRTSEQKVVMGGKQAVCTGDFMWVFTKDFWQFQQRKNRAKTQQILREYANIPIYKNIPAYQDASVCHHASVYHRTSELSLPVDSRLSMGSKVLVGTAEVPVSEESVVGR